MICSTLKCHIPHFSNLLKSEWLSFVLSMWMLFSQALQQQLSYLWLQLQLHSLLREVFSKVPGQKRHCFFWSQFHHKRPRASITAFCKQAESWNEVLLFWCTWEFYFELQVFSSSNKFNFTHWLVSHHIDDKISWEI